MADVGTYDIPEYLHDRGWAVRRGFAYVVSQKLTPTALLPAVWSVGAPSSNNIVEEILVSSDTTMDVTIATAVSVAGLSGVQGYNRKNGALLGGGLCGAAVIAVPGGTTAMFTEHVLAGTDARLLQRQWFHIDALTYLSVYTPAVAANVTVTFFGRIF